MKLQLVAQVVFVLWLVRDLAVGWTGSGLPALGGTIGYTIFDLRLWLLAIGILAIAQSARAHEWYPLECCHAMDCAEVETSARTHPVDSAAPSNLIVTTRHGTAIVPQNFPLRESKDGRMHACMRPGEGGTMRLICIFVPPSM